MITKAIGGARSSKIRAANTKRTIGRLKIRMSSICCPKSTIVTISPIVSTASSGTRMNSAFPGNVRRSQVRVMTAIRSESLVDAAHHGIQRRHDRHGVGEEVPGQQRADGLE